MSEENSATIETYAAAFNYGTTCVVCGDYIDLGRYPPRNYLRVCEECLTRLNKLLYPEREADHDTE